MLTLSCQMCSLEIQHVNPRVKFCPDCRAIDKRRRANARMRRWRECPENRAKSQEHSRRWMKENPDRARGQLNQWKERNPERWREISSSASARRRARKRDSDAECFSRREIWDRDGNICLYCEGELTYDSWHMDHFVPLSRGGLHRASNCVVSCIPCNSQKHNSMPEEFIRARRLV